MKYHTKSLWIRLEDDNDKKAIQLWKIANTRYRKQFVRIRRKLDKKTYLFFKEHDTHGHYILDINVKYKGRLLQRHYGNEIGFGGKKKQIDLIMKTLCPAKAIYEISYLNVKTFQIDNTPDNRMNYLYENGYDSLRYCELVSERKGLCHHLLFHSGAEFSIHSESIKVKKLKIDKKGTGEQDAKRTWQKSAATPLSSLLE